MSTLLDQSSLSAKSYHVLSTLHKFLADNFARIIFASFDMDRFLDNCIRPTSKCLTSSVLNEKEKNP